MEGASDVGEVYSSPPKPPLNSEVSLASAWKLYLCLHYALMHSMRPGGMGLVFWTAIGTRQAETQLDHHLSLSFPFPFTCKCSCGTGSKEWCNLSFQSGDQPGTNATSLDVRRLGVLGFLVLEFPYADPCSPCECARSSTGSNQIWWSMQGLGILLNCWESMLLLWKPDCRSNFSWITCSTSLKWGGMEVPSWAWHEIQALFIISKNLPLSVPYAIKAIQSPKKKRRIHVSDVRRLEAVTRLQPHFWPPGFPDEFSMWVHMPKSPIKFQFITALRFILHSCSYGAPKWVVTVASCTSVASVSWRSWL